MSLLSITMFIRRLKAGDQDAAGPLWEYYFQRMVRRAGTVLRDANCRAVSAEDAAQHAFDNFCRRAQQGCFQDSHDRDNLWPLLAKITARKARDLLRQETRQKRGGGEVRGESVWLTSQSPEHEAGIEQIVDDALTPDQAAQAAEECQRLLDSLQDASLRSVAVWKLEGYTNEEIAARLGTVTRTVERKLNTIRQIWIQQGYAR